MSITVVIDCIGSNLSAVLVGRENAQFAGYTTGSGGIAWTAAQFDRSPAPVRICQDAGATDTTADVLDVETGAATVADVPGWTKAALANFNAAKRPGQRKPTIYVNQSNMTAVCNALQAAGLTANLWLADYSLSQATATTDVEDASGPYPLIGVQFDPDVLNLYDVSIMSSAWLADVSGKPKPAPAPKTEVTVPSVIGRKDLGTAESIIKAAGLVAKATGDSPVGNDGEVTAQSPAAGTKVESGSTVTLTYTVDVEVPNLIGRTDLAFIESLVKDAGLSISNTGKVTSQSPKAATKVHKGTAVTVTYTM